MKNTKDMTQGNTAKIIFSFFLPMLMTNLLQQVYNFADTAIVGKGLGDNALAAVGNMSSLTFLIIGFSMGMANGFSVIISQNYGAKDIKADIGISHSSQLAVPQKDNDTHADLRYHNRRQSQVRIYHFRRTYSNYRI